MRELVFDLEYEPGQDSVAETLVEHPGTTIRSLDCHATSERLWRVDHASGPSEGLSALETAYTTAEYTPDCLVTGDCDAPSSVSVLERGSDRLVVYCKWERSRVCTSVPHLALEHLGEGLLFETTREERSHRWRIVLSDEGDLAAFADDLRDEIEDVGGMTLRRLRDHTPGAPRVAPSLPVEQRRALEAAVELGYYEVPRQVELTELAEVLAVPRSTLSYRLRRAEAALAAEFVATDDTPAPWRTPIKT